MTFIWKDVQILVDHDLADGGRQEGVLAEDRDARVDARHRRESAAMIRLVDHALAGEALHVQVQVGRGVVVQVQEARCRAAPRARGLQIGADVVAAAAVGDRVRRGRRRRAFAQHEGRERAVGPEVAAIQRRGGRHAAVDEAAEGGDRPTRRSGGSDIRRRRMPVRVVDQAPALVPVAARR